MSELWTYVGDGSVFLFSAGLPPTVAWSGTAYGSLYSGEGQQLTLQCLFDAVTANTRLCWRQVGQPRRDKEGRCIAEGTALVMVTNSQVSLQGVAGYGSN